MNSSTFLSCSSDSSAPATGSGMASPHALRRGEAIISGKQGSAELAARVKDPEARDIGRAVGALHGLERLHAARLLAVGELRFAQAQLRVLGTPEAALLDALLDHPEALLALAFVDVLEAELHEVVAVRGSRGVLLVLGARLLHLGEALGDV